jgi:hypothetical protein
MSHRIADHFFKGSVLLVEIEIVPFKIVGIKILPAIIVQIPNCNAQSESDGTAIDTGLPAYIVEMSMIIAYRRSPFSGSRMVRRFRE